MNYNRDMKNFIILALFLASSQVAVQGLPIALSVGNVKRGEGPVYVAVFDNPEGFKKVKPVKQLSIVADGERLSAVVELPKGEYVFSLYQDLNGNGKLDTNFLGIPKEPVGISNYSGKGIPGGFEKQKVLIDADRLSLEISLREIGK